MKIIDIIKSNSKVLEAFSKAELIDLYELFKLSIY